MTAYFAQQCLIYSGYSRIHWFFASFRSIRRIIFNSLVKPSVNEKGERELDTITTSQALQISGRAGRFSSVFKEGEVTTMQRDDLPVLKEIMGKPIDPIEVRVILSIRKVNMLFGKGFIICWFLIHSWSQTAGLHPTAEQIEMFAYHLPKRLSQTSL